MDVSEQVVVVGPLAKINEMLKAGVHDELKNLALAWENVKARAENGDWQFDMAPFDDDQLDHIKRDWLGVGGESWFRGIDAAATLEKGFARAMSVAGDRPVASIWVPARSFEHVTVSVVENPTSVVVVITSPMPPDDAPTSDRDTNVTEYSTSGESAS